MIEIVHGAAAHGQLADHREWVQEGDVPLLPKVEVLVFLVL